LVCNTDVSSKPGIHWVAIYVDEEGHGDYFDSFGRPPTKQFEYYLNAYCVRWSYNRKQLQSINSIFCGYYACFYCLYRSRNIDMNSIVNMFTSDTGFNDSIVHSFVTNKIS